MVKKSLFFGCVLATATLLLFTGCPTDSGETDSKVDKSALTQGITNAETEVNGITVDTAGENVSNGVSWVTQAVKDAYEAAITAAKTVANKADATQEEVDKALTALLQATGTFTSAKQKGTKTVSKTVLIQQITAAETAVQAIKVDTAAENVPQGVSWVTQAVKTAYETAITAAKTVKDKADASETEIDSAMAALKTATDTFKAAQQTGTKAVSKDDLTGEITAAEDAMQEIIVAEDGETVSLEDFWVTQAVKDAYEAAITAAKTVANKADATQAELNTALTDLLQATETFNSARQAGAKVPVSKDGLTLAIAAAEDAVEEVTVSTSAASVVAGKYWVTQAVKDAYEAAITAAKAVKDKADAKQKDVDRALAALNEATKEFEDAQAEGINKPVYPEIVFDTTVIVYHDDTPLSRDQVIPVGLNTSYAVNLSAAYGYTNIHWYINGIEQRFPDTMSTLLLPTGKAMTLVVSVQADSDGRTDTSGNYTFEVK
jgi:tetratricopeptide (TPR) repeat protein